MRAYCMTHLIARPIWWILLIFKMIPNPWTWDMQDLTRYKQRRIKGGQEGDTVPPIFQKGKHKKQIKDKTNPFQTI